MFIVEYYSEYLTQWFPYTFQKFKEHKAAEMWVISELYQIVRHKRQIRIREMKKDITLCLK